MYVPRMSTDDLAWMRELQAALWPPEQAEKGRLKTPHGPVQLKLEAKRQLKKREWKQVKKAIAEHKLIVEMGGTNMFGGVGIWIHEHPPMPGIDKPELILNLTQEHLPGKTGKKGSEPTQGACLTEAWEMFSELADTDQNLRWLKQYGLELPKSASSYDY